MNKIIEHHREDVIEHAMTFGYTSAQTRFGLDREVIKAYVKDFLIDVYGTIKCSCKDSSGRMTILCFTGCREGEPAYSMQTQERLHKMQSN